MTKPEIKQVTQALTRLAGKCKAEPADSTGQVVKVSLPLQGRNGQEFRVYTFKRPRSKKILFSDGGALVKELQTAGSLQLKGIQVLLETYGLSLMEDLSVMDTSNRTLSARLASFLQAWVAVDGVLRMWESLKETVSAETV